MTNEIPIEKSGKPLISILAEGTAWLLASLFSYTAVSKGYDWQETRFAMHNQWLPGGLTEILLYGLPLIEILAALALLIPRMRKTGFMLSSILMTLFTGYVGYVWLGFTGRMPCSCGGVLGSMGWGEHLIFNLVFLGIALMGYWSHGKITQLEN